MVVYLYSFTLFEVRTHFFSFILSDSSYVCAVVIRFKNTLFERLRYHLGVDIKLSVYSSTDDHSCSYQLNKELILDVTLFLHKSLALIVRDTDAF